MKHVKKNGREFYVPPKNGQQQMNHTIQQAGYFSFQLLELDGLVEPEDYEDICEAVEILRLAQRKALGRKEALEAEERKAVHEMKDALEQLIVTTEKKTDAVPEEVLTRGKKALLAYTVI